MKESVGSVLYIGSEQSSSAWFADCEVSFSLREFVPEELEVFLVEWESLVAGFALEGFYGC